MSKSTDPDFNLELHFLPAWAQQSTDKNPYAHFAGEPAGDARRDRRGRGPRRDTGPGGRSGRDTPRGPGGGQSLGQSRGQGARRPEPGGRGRGEPMRKPERPEAPLVEVDVALVPDDVGVDSLVKQIRMTGRAYPLFDIARMILQRPERHGVRLSVRKDAQGGPKQPLFLCAIDQTLWTSEEEAMRHALSRHFEMFYQPEKTQIEPPKGTYTFVAQCGMSGAILGPPNHHDYQNQLRKLHAQRFGRMPFETFKARVKIVKDEAVVKQWLEDQSFKIQFQCLNTPEAITLPNREDVERHFRETHLKTIVQPVESFQLQASDARQMPCHELARLVRVNTEDQKRFPLQIATVLSQQFATRGLQFFKVNRTITHVSVARPHFLDLEATPVSDGVKRIVDFINAHPGCTRKALFESLAPHLIKPAPPAAAEGTAEVAAPDLTPQDTAIVTDLHWLIHQGHVIEFANGIMETAKKPVPKPPRSVPIAATPSVPPVGATEAAAGPAAAPASHEAAAEAPAAENAAVYDEIGNEGADGRISKAASADPEASERELARDPAVSATPPNTLATPADSGETARSELER